MKFLITMKILLTFITTIVTLFFNLKQTFFLLHNIYTYSVTNEEHLDIFIQVALLEWSRVQEDREMQTWWQWKNCCSGQGLGLA